MNCAQCGRSIPGDAVFCIYCSSRVQQANPEPAPQEPVTGSTIRLDPVMVAPAAGRYQPNVVLPAPRPNATRRRHMPPPQAQARHHQKDLSGPIFLFGLVTLLMAGAIWPGILLLIGASNFAKEHARGRGDRALGKLLLMGGLALLFWTHTLWPGMLGLMLAMWLFRR